LTQDVLRGYFCTADHVETS